MNKMKDKTYTNINEIRDKYFPEMEIVIMSKKEKDWWELNNPFLNKFKISKVTQKATKGLYTFKNGDKKVVLSRSNGLHKHE